MGRRRRQCHPTANSVASSTNGTTNNSTAALITNAGEETGATESRTEEENAEQRAEKNSKGQREQVENGVSSERSLQASGALGAIYEPPPREFRRAELIGGAVGSGGAKYTIG